MEIQVAETHPPGAGRKMGKIVAADGQHFYAYPDMLARMQTNRCYAVKTESWDDKGGRGKLYKITEATPINGAAPSHPPQQQTSGQVSRGYFDEAAFTGHAVAAMILKGEIDPRSQRQATEATRMWRDIWRATSGN